jgi:hypothetical protein
MNKQNRRDYGNEQNTPVPPITLPKPPGGQDVAAPSPKQLPHPFKQGAPKA